jgi:hypothetical protein
MSAFFEIAAGAVVLVAGGGFLLHRYGLLGKVDDIAKLNATRAVDSMSSAIDKERMNIAKLATLLEQQGDAVTDLDAELATQKDRLTDLQKVLTGKVTDLHDTPIASPGDAGALQRAAMAVSTAEGAVKTQADLITGLQAQATKAHENYNDSLQILTQRQAELPKSEANVILTKATKVGTSIAKQNEAFTAAAAAGDDAKTTIDRELHKAEAEAARRGPSTDQRALAALHARREADDVLARYGMGPAAAPAAPAAT